MESAIKRLTLLITLLYVSMSHAVTWTVSKVDHEANFSSIQAAVNAAQPNDVIIVLDNEVYEEQVTFDSTKSGITLKSQNPLNRNKPIIQWQDRENVGPTTCSEAQDYANINFDRNGALRMIKARNITIDGICIDGGGPLPIAYPGIWNCKDELFFGNAAVCVFSSGNVQIRNCEVRNAYFGFNMKDQNLGGVFTYFYPEDTEFKAAPLTAFGKTGNHQIEYNRIHSNSWGFLFESTWDLGSTIRFNLVYNNYHTQATMAILSTLPGKDHQPGGAFQFKDGYLSPLAIYNNTFWSNYTIFTGHWKPGGQHLIFNNIYGKPKYYWGTGYPGTTKFTDPWHVMDGKSFINRSKYCLYAAQKGAPIVRSQSYMTPCSTSVSVSGVAQVTIMNTIPDGNVTPEGMAMLGQCEDGTTYTLNIPWIKRPGALISSAIGPFPEDANMRWLETDELFQSLDTLDPNFLVPKWDDTLVIKYIKNKGWPEAGIRNSDGSMADIGAISSSGERVPYLWRISPLTPVFISGTTARVQFYLDGNSSDNPRIKYLRWIEKLPVQTNSAFGGTMVPIQAGNIRTVDISGKSVRMGMNFLEFTIPQRGTDSTWEFGFFEMSIEGDGPDGTVCSDIGFLPYRNLEYQLRVEIRNNAGQKLTQVQAGQPVKLSIRPMMIGTSVQLFPFKISPADVSLIIQNTVLYDAFTNQQFEISEFNPDSLYSVYFTSAGSTRIRATGEFKADYRICPFLGLSDSVTVLPSQPEKLLFQNPAPKAIGTSPSIIVPGSEYVTRVQVIDKYNNPVKQPTEVTLASFNPEIGNIVGSPTAQTNESGVALFTVQVTNGKLGDVFDLQATLSTNEAVAIGSLKIGQTTDKLVIFYSDSVSNTPNMEVTLSGTSGTRIPVVIKAIRGDTLLSERSTEFSLSTSAGLQAFSSQDASSPQTTFSLVNGKATVWITSTIGIENGFLTITATDDNSILSGFRESIYFDPLSPINPRLNGKNAQKYNLVVYDLKGRLVARLNNVSRGQDLTLLRKRYPAGSYIIKTQLNGKTISTQRRLIGR